MYVGSEAKEDGGHGSGSPSPLVWLPALARSLLCIGPSAIVTPANGLSNKRERGCVYAAASRTIWQHMQKPLNQLRDGVGRRVGVDDDWQSRAFPRTTTVFIVDIVDVASVSAYRATDLTRYNRLCNRHVTTGRLIVSRLKAARQPECIVGKHSGLKTAWVPMSAFPNARMHALGAVAKTAPLPSPSQAQDPASDSRGESDFT